MARLVEFFYDFRNPYSYLAYAQLREMSTEIALRPMNVLGLMEMVGNVPTSVTCAAKGRYVRADLARWCERSAIVFNPTNPMMLNGDVCARAVLAASSPDDAATISWALFRAGWSEATPLATTDEILNLVAAAGVDLAPIAAKIDNPETTALLDANTGEAAGRGAFGSPTMFVGEDMFFGNDRLDFVRDALAREEQSA